MPREWYDTETWDDGPDALEHFLAQVRRARRNGQVYAMRKVARLAAAGDPARLAAALQIVTVLLEEQERQARPGLLLRERRAALYRDARRFAEAEADYRACIAIYDALGDEAGVTGVLDDLGRVLVQSPDPATRAEGEACLQTYYARHNVTRYRPYDEIAPLLTYERPLITDRAGRSLVAAELIGIAFDDDVVIRRGDASAVAALDAALSARPPLHAYAPAFVQDELLPELGAYLGNLLVRHWGGVWRHAAPLARARVALDGTPYDPFQAAFRTIYFFYPLRYLVPS